MTRRPEAILFGHMHEDHSSELYLVPKLPTASALVIASGGDLTFCLAGAGLAVTAVDSNPAQIDLLELKMRIAQEFDVEQASAMMICDARGLALTGVDVQRGLCFCGKVDRMLRRFGPALPRLHDLIHPTPDKTRDVVLVLLHGALRLGVGLVHGRTASAMLDSRAVRLFAERLDHALRQRDAETNPLLQVLLGRGFGKQVPAVWSSDGIARWRQHVKDIHLHISRIEDALAKCPSKSLGLISVSNLPDLMSANAWQALLQSAVRTLAPGGYLIARSMLRKAIAEPVGDYFDDVTNEVRQAASDQSPLCPIVWVGKRASSAASHY